MKKPQTLAQTIASRCSIIGKSGCLAFVYIWCMGLDPEDGEAIRIVADAMRADTIKEDCTVYAEPFLERLTGKHWTVEKRKIRSLDEVKDIERCAVLYSNDGRNGHWVGVEKGNIAFNSIDFSINVEDGMPISARIIQLKE